MCSLGDDEYLGKSTKGKQGAIRAAQQAEAERTAPKKDTDLREGCRSDCDRSWS